MAARKIDRKGRKHPQDKIDKICMVRVPGAIQLFIKYKKKIMREAGIRSRSVANG